MASQVPTGYNPETSLLSGGTAPILPVQGGGSMEAGAAPAGYNPDASLLNTGRDVPIQAIRGGGEGEKPYESYTLEQYDPPLKMISIPVLPDNTTRRTVIAEYTKQSKPELMEVKRLEREPEPFTERDDVAPTYQKCSTREGRRRLPLNFFELVRKRIVFIDEPDPKIWIIPNLKGDISKFLQYMNMIPKGADGNIDPTHFVFFTGSFFSLTSIRDNMILYHQFLLMKNKQMKNLFYLNHLNDDFINVSCSLFSSLYSTETLKAPEAKDKPLTTFFEPDIVIFTKPHILLKNSEPPVQREDNRVKASTLLTRPDFKQKSFLLIPSREVFDEFPSDDSDVPEKDRWFSFAFNRSVIKQIKKPKTSEIICPKGNTCNGFVGGYKVVDVGDDRKLETPGLYLLYKNTDKMPFLKEAGAKLTPEELGLLKPVEEEKEKEVDVVEIEPEVPPVVATPKPKKKSLVLPGIDVVKPPPEEPFKSDPSAIAAKNERTIEINTQEYRIRVPFEKAVKDDWLKAKFTDSEVEFLQTLQFTPKLLSDTFGTGEWKARLAEFLEKIVLSDCFQDTTLLTHIECSNAQQFVRKVYLQLYNRTLQDIYSEMGVPKPESFDTLLQQMKKLQSVGPVKGSTFLDKYDYTGDLLERFQVIYFNKEKGEYFTDFTEMSNATREILKKMKLYRVEDMDIDEITRAILERLKIPVPPRPSAPPVNDSNTESVESEAESEAKSEEEEAEEEAGSIEQGDSNTSSSIAVPPPPPGSPSSVSEEEKQCKFVFDFLNSSKLITRIRQGVKTYKEEDIINYLGGDGFDAASKLGVTYDTFLECIEKKNKEIRDKNPSIKKSYEIVASFQGESIPANEYVITNVSGDGWCFYYSLLQSVGGPPDFAILEDGKIKTLADIQDYVTKFIEDIKKNINASPRKAEWATNYEDHYPGQTYQGYIDSLLNIKPHTWADPEYGVGQAAADILKATIKVCQQDGNRFNVTQTYRPTVAADPSRVIRVNYVGRNHYQILTKKAQASSSALGAGAGLPKPMPPPVPPVAKGNRYTMYNLPGPDPKDEECVDLWKQLETKSGRNYFPNNRISEVNAYLLREDLRDRTKHQDYSIYFLAKCWDKRPDLFPKDKYGFDAFLIREGVGFRRDPTREWVEPYFLNPRTGNPTPQEVQRIVAELKRLNIKDPQNLSATDLATMSNLSYDFSYPFVKKALEGNTTYRIKPSYAVTIPDFDPATSQGGGGANEEEDEVFEVGGALKLTYRKQTKRVKKHSSHPSRRHGRHKNRTLKQK